MSDATAARGVPAELAARVSAWIAGDPDAHDRAELAVLLAQAEHDGTTAAELTDRFAGSLRFGTAGLRGVMAAGPNRMNRAVVIRAAYGLAGYLLARGLTGPVVIGYDARRHSAEFARDTAGVLAAAGVPALVMPRSLPTPVLAFAVRRLAAVAGVMVTASHNPAADNGYKVYLGDGCQIVPPADADIAALIDAAPAAVAIAQAEGWEWIDGGIVDDYLAAITASVDPAGPRALRVVHTAMHGVGGPIAAAALERAGFATPDAVPEQAEPDPDFPTLPFPNPEEAGALDLAIARAAGSGADLVVASDPDADRCAVAVPDPLRRGAVRGWRALTGDEVGALLGDHLLRRGRQGVLATTIVSSTLLAKIAAAHGAAYQETLTGFKWIGRVPGLAFGYEEAIGYCAVPAAVADKDGISAMLLVCELAAGLAAEGRTLLDRLDELARAHGVHATGQLALRVADLALLDEAVRRLLSSPPAQLGGLAVLHVDDLSAGGAGLPPTPGVRLQLAERARVVVRPSGTEPKLKCYLEVVEPVPTEPPEALSAARAVAAGRLAAIRTDLSALLTL